MKNLLSVILLVSSILLSAQPPAPIQLQFLRDNVHSISMEDDFINGNWQSLDKVVEGKRVVSLGEFNHGSREVFLVRNDIIKYLHKQHGYNVILFESGIGELISLNQKKEELSPNQMTSGFFSNWRSEEFRDLMEFIQKENIRIGGFDVQRFGGLFKDVLAENSKGQGLIEDKFTSIQRKITSRKAVYDSLSDETTDLVQNYETLLHSLDSLDESSKLVKRTLENRIHFLSLRLQFLEDRDWNQRWLARDSMMAENVKWWIKNFYPEEKIILVAHNFHISRHNGKEEVMGEYLDKELGEDMCAIGFFAGQGSYKGNYGNIEKLSPPDSSSLDIKHFINALQAGVHLLSIPQNSSQGSSWLFEPIIVNDTFIDLSSSNQLILSKHFDALILLDKVTPPKD